LKERRHRTLTIICHQSLHHANTTQRVITGIQYEHLILIERLVFAAQARIDCVAHVATNEERSYAVQVLKCCVLYAV
jgi:hypothetical protein